MCLSWKIVCIQGTDILPALCGCGYSAPDHCNEEMWGPRQKLTIQIL